MTCFSVVCQQRTVSCPKVNKMAARRVFHGAFMLIFLAVWMLGLLYGCQGASLGDTWEQEDGSNQQYNAELVVHDVRFKRQAQSANATESDPTTIPQPGTGTPAVTPYVSLLDVIMEQGNAWPFWVIFGAAGGVVAIFLFALIIYYATKKEETAEERMKRLARAEEARQ
ncbi:Hypp4794 [Branchiostoma lanceolatum]|uniref:Hypp4794 protein n=1 Tax=Branchiostoma lanceolatum TaxID=7740 RepID=A0A8K0AAZ4_BRALA|nr:Hypp4794 [Branchiostoma lanceolatum]